MPPIPSSGSGRAQAPIPLVATRTSQWTQAEINLAAEALDIASAAIRRLMAISEMPRQEIESTSKRTRRLIERLRCGGVIEDREAAFVAGALAMAAAMHRTAAGRDVRRPRRENGPRRRLGREGWRRGKIGTGKSGRRSSRLLRGGATGSMKCM